MNILFDIWGNIQKNLFPKLEEELGSLTKKEKHFVEVLAIADLNSHIVEYEWKGKGRKRKQRINFARAYLAKSIYNLPTTDMLIEMLMGSNNLRRLCGWESRYQVPSKPTFSRAFTEFAEKGFISQVFATTVTTHCGGKIAGHVSRDSTPIIAREKPAKKEPKAQSKQPKRKPGRPRKGEVVEPKPPKRLDLQPTRTLEENLADLPTQCDKGTKKDSKGYKKSWNGYKLHIDCIDGDIPVSAALTAASLHDSQVAIPLAQMTAQRVPNLYDLMDAAYDAATIKNFSIKLGHVPIIDHNPRGGVKIHMDSATKKRYGERSAAERINAYLKDNYGGRHVRVKGAQKVFTHLMFGLLAITATQILRLAL